MTKQQEAFPRLQGDERRPTIIAARRYGQLGNCLYLYAHLIAAACEHDAQVWFPAFAKYARFFRTTSDDIWCRYPAVESRLPSHEWMRKLAHQTAYFPSRMLLGLGVKEWPLWSIKLRGYEQCDLDDEFAVMLRERGRVFVHGWMFRATDAAFTKHQPAIREHLRPIEPHETNARERVLAARSYGDFLVGVHIRHGDYAEYRDGLYFYSVERYGIVMRRICEQLAGRRVHFLVCSDAPWSEADFPSLSVSFGTGHLIEDMYALAACDFLIGPPSTFSGWSSIYGQVPIHRIFNPEEDKIELPAAARAA